MKKIFKVLGYDDEGNREPAPPSKKDKHKNDDAKNPPATIQEKDKNEPLMTAFGELVYMRNSNKDFVSKQKFMFHEPKDEVLEENLLDVKNLLKFSTSSQAANGKQPG